MIRSDKIKWGKIRVGVIITFALMMLLYSSFRGGGTSIFDPKNNMVAYFGNVNGLVKGAPVRLGGVEVGNVKSIKFVNLDADRRIRAVLSIKSSVWEFITVDSKVKLGTIGLLGDKYIEVIPGTSGLEVMKDGDEIGVLPEGGMEAVMEKIPNIAGSVDDLLTNIKQITSVCLTGDGTAGRIFSDPALYIKLVDALDRATVVLTEVKQKQTKILDGLGGTLDNTQKITARIESGQGSLGKLISEDELYNNLASSSARFDSILNRLEEGRGTIGAFINDDQLYEEMKNLIVRMNNLVSDIEENPGRYFKFSVF